VEELMYTKKESTRSPRENIKIKDYSNKDKDNINMKVKYIECRAVD
jgi:hypothetical protein